MVEEIKTTENTETTAETAAVKATPKRKKALRQKLLAVKYMFSQHTTTQSFQ